MRQPKITHSSVFNDGKGIWRPNLDYTYYWEQFSTAQWTHVLSLIALPVSSENSLDWRVMRTFSNTVNYHIKWCFLCCCSFVALWVLLLSPSLSLSSARCKPFWPLFKALAEKKRHLSRLLLLPLLLLFLAFSQLNTKAPPRRGGDVSSREDTIEAFEKCCSTKCKHKREETFLFFSFGRFH